MDTPPTIALVTQLGFSSGLAARLRDALRGAGVGVAMVDALASKWFKLPAVLKSLDWDRDRMWRKRWENTLFCPWAWRRNTRRNGRLLRRLGGRPRILQVGGIYAPCPEYRETEYYLLVGYTTKLSLADRAKPWVPRPADREAFVELQRDLYAHARHIFTHTAYVKRHLAADYGVPEDRMTVTGIGVNPFYPAHLPAEIPAAPARHLLFVGKDFGYKGGADLLEAFRIARQAIPELALTVVGPDPAAVPALDGVCCTGPIGSPERLLEYYRSADLFVMPSLCDSFGFVFLEAMTQGLPCIGTDLNAMPEIIADGETGYIVPLRDPAALAGAILKYYGDPGNRRRLGAAAQRRVLERYTWERVVARMAPRLLGAGAAGAATG